MSEQSLQRLAELNSVHPELKSLADPMVAFWISSRDTVISLLQATLESLANQLASLGVLGQLPPEDRERYELILELARELGAMFGLTVLPANWRLASGSTPEAADDIEKTVVFRPEVPAGSLIRLKQFGLRQGEVLIQPARYSVSAGPAPVGFAELENQLTLEPDYESLAIELKSWRAASLEGTLELAAVEFYLHFWDHSARESLQGLVLDLMMEGFGLTPFYPQRFQDHPDGWIQLADTTRIITGRVREVLRPGLLDEAGRLRVPARVVAD